jgi:hypothetical protein
MRDVATGMAARRVELRLRRPGVSGYEPSMGRCVKIVRDKRPLLHQRLRATAHQQPVVKRQRRTEAGEAPRGQGATTENTGSI